MNYSKYADKAFTKLKQYGSEITVKASENKKYDCELNAYVDTGETYKGYAIMRNFNQKNIDGTNIKFGDVLFTAGIKGKVKTNDRIVFNDKSYTVVNVEIINPDGKTDILYNIHAR